MYLAKPSTMKEPPIVTVRLAGRTRTAIRATRRSASAPRVTRAAERSPRYAPMRMRIRTPTARMISGSAGPKAGVVTSGFMRASVEGQNGGGLGQRHGGLVALQEGVSRGRKGVEDRSGLDAVVDDQNRQRRQDRDLAPAQVGDALKRGLFQATEDDAGVEPERVGRREDDARRGEEGHCRIGPEGAQKAQELTHEARGARQADVRHGEDHHGEG